MDNKYRTQFNQIKKDKREKKRCEKRSITGEEVIFIFEKFIEGWTTIRIYNVIIQNNKNSSIDKKKVETIVSGNCKVYENELSTEKYKQYLELRQKVYEIHKNNKE
jgi:hypothetical protein